MLEVVEHDGYNTYKSEFTANDGRIFELKVMPIYRSGTTSIVSMSGGRARIEICEKRKNDWMLYRLAYTNVIESKTNFSQNVVQEVSRAFVQLKIVPEYEPMRLDFFECGRVRSLVA